jgi:hypothetical protein
MKSLKKSFPGLFLGVFVITVFMACQAAQSKPRTKSQKQASTEQTASKTVKTDTGKIDTGETPVISDRKIIVYYFHGNMRCHTCYNLENYAKLVVESDFQDAVKNGKLEWKTVNVETAGNEHFSNDYKLYTKSVIVSTVVGGKEVSWKNLDQIWQLIHNEPEYNDYIGREVKACLEGKCL